jgi:tetratricopeptide (TPR) repeat protein
MSKYDQARTELDAAIRLDPTNERARLALAEMYIASQETAPARVALAEAIKAIPASGEAHWKLGTLHQAFGDDANAARSFEAAAKLFPFAGVGRLYRALGRVHHNVLDLDAAMAAYRRRLAVTPNESAAHLDLADVYRAQDRHDEALAEALVAAVLDPTSPRSFATIGQIHAAAGRDEEAVLSLRKAVALEPSHLEAHYALSRALARLNRPDEAREELQIFERLQAKAMEDQRRQFQENLQRIEETLKTTEPKDRVR